MFRSIDVAYWKPSNLNKISLIFGIWHGLCFNYLFGFLKSIINHNRFALGLGCAKYRDPYSELFAFWWNISRNKRSTSFLNIYFCTFGNGFGFTYSFNPVSTGYFSQVPSVPSNNSSVFVIFLAIQYVAFMWNVGIAFCYLI